MKIKKKIFLYWIILFSFFIFLFLALNLISNLLIKHYLKVSIFDEEYLSVQQRFIKIKKKSFVHPFYGINSGGEIGFISDVSIEENFISVSPKPLTGEIKVLVTGGSVATQLSLEGLGSKRKSYLLAKQLNKRFNTDRFVIYNAAQGGGKQPMQYFKYLYLDLLGFKPDLIINYDGFNEVVLPFKDNFKKNLNAIYPRSFNESINSTAINFTPWVECIDLNNKMLSNNSYIPIYEFAKWVYVKRCHNKVVGMNKKIWPFISEENKNLEKSNYLQKVLNIWSYSSNKTYSLAKTKKTPYLHIIQPNQYLKNSKKFSEKENKEVLTRPFFKNIIERHYNKLNLNMLLTDNKLDQRFLFKDEERTVYLDNCCHFNNLGITIIIDNLIDSFIPVFNSVLKSS
jgi:hypothetical protein